MKNTLVIGGIALALVLSLVAVFSPQQIVDRVVVKEVPALGSAGPELLYPEFNHNGAKVYSYGQPFIKTTGSTSTVCVFRAPSGTSTLEYAAISATAFTNAGADGNFLGIAYNDLKNSYTGTANLATTTGDATGTVLVSFNNRTGADGFVAKATNTTILLRDTLVASSSVIKMYAGNSTSATGTCSVQFRLP